MKNEISYLFIKINVAVNLPRIFYIFLFPWKWHGRPKCAV